MNSITEYKKSKLSVEGVAAYDRILLAVERNVDKVECSGIQNDEIVNIYNAVLDDHPELFFLSTSVRAATSAIGFFAKTVQLMLDRIYSPSDINAANQAFDRIENELKSMLGAGASEVQRVEAIAEYAVMTANYEIDNTYNQNAASALFFKRAQCSGFSRATKLLCDRLGIYSMVIDGTGTDSNGVTAAHSWNIVRVDGEFYHLDVTYMLGANMQKRTPLRKVCFLISDSEASKDHAWDRSYYPECRSNYRMPAYTQTPTYTQRPTQTQSTAQTQGGSRGQSGSSSQRPSFPNPFARLAKQFASPRPTGQSAPQRPTGQAAPQRPTGQAAPQRPTGQAAPQRPVQQTQNQRPVNGSATGSQADHGIARFNALYNVREYITTAIRAKKTEVEFIFESDTLSGESLMKSVKESCQTVMQKYGFAIQIGISISGNHVKLELKY